MKLNIKEFSLKIYADQPENFIFTLQLKNLFVESKHAVDIALMKRLLSVDIICLTEIQLGYWIKM